MMIKLLFLAGGDLCLVLLGNSKLRCVLGVEMWVLRETFYEYFNLNYGAGIP